MGIWVCGSCWDSLGVVAGAGGVSSGPPPFQHVPGSEMGPEQEGVPCSVEGSVGSYVLHWVQVGLASHHSCLEISGNLPSGWGHPLVVLEAADKLICSAAAGSILHPHLPLPLHHLGTHGGGC